MEPLITDTIFYSDHLLSKLSSSIELLKLDTSLKRVFYEAEVIKNNWSVRDLQRAMNSMLYKRTGLSTNKHAVLNGEEKGKDLKAEDILQLLYVGVFRTARKSNIY